MRLRIIAFLGCMWASPLWAANVTLVGTDGYTPIGNSSSNPLFVTGGGGGGGGGAVYGSTAPGAAPTGTGANPFLNGFLNGSGQVTTVSPTAGLPISAAALPLPTGAATAANQNSTVAGTSASNGNGVQGVTGGVPVATTSTSNIYPLLTAASTTGPQTAGVNAGGYCQNGPTGTFGGASVQLNQIVNGTPVPVGPVLTSTPAPTKAFCFTAGQGTIYQDVITGGSGTSLTDSLNGTGAGPLPNNGVVNPGVGAITAVPAGTTNGTALGTFPANAKGARLYLPTGTSITYTIAATAPSSAPTATFTVSASTTGPNWDENLNGQMIYVTAITGAPLFRWF